MLIGYPLNDALMKLSDTKEVIVEETKAPSFHSDNEPDWSNPIIVRQKEDGNRVVLTVSFFK